MPHPPAPQDQSREPNNFSQLRVDYVSVFSLSPLPHQPKLRKQAIDDRARHRTQLLEE
ncbi:hypothetical protein PTTG_12800 [Puccinia triticina 1-1 BBBD Race 1]|uniref:Uncharacterized protein n=1 Tax=Puccinia triticina (isolate 1-1 / race 1 (BBBD)) TaxID=630390 RepID=A0A180G608_PUCT1|nr:hypothetical protein PTTG_12800 [Puccinia triticina 1-1 BBBD Race 1]